MKYDITQGSAPSISKLCKGTECIQILLLQASKDMYDPLVSKLYPFFGAKKGVRKFSTTTSVGRSNSLFNRCCDRISGYL